MLPKQQSFILSPYIELYNILIPKGNLLRRMDELVDFSFVYEELNERYCQDNGRTAVDPVGMFRKEDEFDFNKDAGMYVCRAGHLAIRRARQGKKGQGKNQKDTYFYDIEKCKRCPLKEGYYTEGAQSKTYSVSIKSNEHAKQAVFQESELFKVKAKERYKNRSHE